MVAFEWRNEEGTTGGLAPGGVVMTAFPSAGLATIVAGHYIVRSLKLPRVGRFESPDLAPIAVVQGGEVSPTVRVYGRPDLALVLSEFPPTPSQANAIAGAVLETAEKQRARLIICLEGVVPHPSEDDEEEAIPPSKSAAPEQVWVAFSRRDPGTVKTFLDTKARPLEDGVIGGVSGALLIGGLGRKVPVAALLVSARAAEGLPDHRAGAALIEMLDRLLPELKIDTGPLRKQAEQIERMLRAAMKTQPTPAEPPGEIHPEPAMYG
jgi:uncharacterized protein